MQKNRSQVIAWRRLRTVWIKISLTYSSNAPTPLFFHLRWVTRIPYSTGCLRYYQSSARHNQKRWWRMTTWRLYYFLYWTKEQGSAQVSRLVSISLAKSTNYHGRHRCERFQAKMRAVTEERKAHAPRLRTPGNSRGMFIDPRLLNKSCQAPTLIPPAWVDGNRSSWRRSIISPG